MKRTIDITPTWPQAARIIAAVLETGTDKGRAAARAELFRMADLLDKLLSQQVFPRHDVAAPARIDTQEPTP